MLGFIVSVWPNRPKEQSHPRHVTCRSETSSLCIFLGNSRTERGQNTARRSDDNQRIAILPLDNISSDSRDEYFAEGMAEELISAASRIKGLGVIARTSVIRYWATTKPIVEIARELNVGPVLEGSVRKGFAGE